MHSMTKIFVYAILLLVSLALAACSSDITIDSLPPTEEVDAPAEAAKEWYEAVNTMEALAADSLVCEAQREAFRREMEAGSLFFTSAESLLASDQDIELDISDVEFRTMNQERDTATVRARGEVRAAVGSSLYSEAISERWEMVEEDGEWKWCENIAAEIAETRPTLAAKPTEVDEPEAAPVGDSTATAAHDNRVELNTSIEAGVITGLVTNGTLDEPLADAEVTLRAFTPDFTQTMKMTTTVDAAGIYTFEVEDVPQDWVFIAGTEFANLNYSSPAAQLSPGRTEIDLPITVYDRSTDPSGVNISQVHVVLEFPAEEQVRVDELYIFNNDQDAVFVGESGDPLQGTIELSVPADAEALEFQRSFGSMDSFMPANDFIQTEAGWADTLPLRPGNNALTLLVRYILPYEDEMTLTHSLLYDVSFGSIIVPDGVEISGSGWLANESQTSNNGSSLLNYTHSGLKAGDVIDVHLAPITTSRVAALNVELWPDYDRPSMLVLLDGTLPAEASLPAKLYIPVPASAEVTAVARVSDLLVSDIDFTIANGWLAFETPSDHFHIEYYDAYEVADNVHSYVFQWLSNTSIDKLSAIVQRPRAATRINVTPEPAGLSSDRGDGLSYYILEPVPLAAGDPYSVEVRYTVDTMILSAP